MPKKKKQPRTPAARGTGRDLSGWGYRVVKASDHPGCKLGYAIYEVFYNRAGEICGITEDPAFPFGETIDELRGDLEYMLNDLSLPVLEEEKIKWGKSDFED